MPLYTAFGIIFDADLPLPQLVTSNKPATAVIRRMQGLQPSEVGLSSRRYTVLDENEIYLNWSPLIGNFRVMNGREIAYSVRPDLEENLLSNFIVTAAMNILLHQRGYLLLHGSAVMIHGKAVGFLGRSGQGKSTLAAACAAEGHRIIADDTIAIDVETASEPQIYPAFPQLKLWSEAIQRLGGNPDDMLKVYSLGEKYAARVLNGFVSDPTPLTHLYALTESNAEISIEPCSPQAAFTEVIMNSYAGHLFATYGFDLLRETHRSSDHFQKCIQLLQAVPVSTLRRPLSFEALPRVIQMLQEATI